MIKKKTFTTTWNVDDTKLSHVDEKVVDKMIKWMKTLYGDDLRISRKKRHDYLGMSIDLLAERQVTVTMVEYLKGVISNFEEVKILTVTASSRAKRHLYTVREGCKHKKLDEKRGTAFHRAVAQLLFVCPRARKDIQKATSFLTKKVRYPDEYDWVKLKHLLRYSRQTINMPLILRVDSLKIIKWWVDASYAVHLDMRGHTGATMSFVGVSVTGIAKNHKINVKSSTEAELIGARKSLPQMLWTQYSIEAQCFTIDESIILQNNLRAMLLEQNGMASSSKQTNHIRVRYYLIKYCIAVGDIAVKHCPTKEILSYHFTKPLQGALFRKFRAEIQGIPTTMDEREMGCHAPGPFNVTP